MKKKLIVTGLFIVTLMINPIALYSMEYEDCVSCVGYEYDTDGTCDDGSCDSDDTEEADID